MKKSLNKILLYLFIIATIAPAVAQKLNSLKQKNSLLLVELKKLTSSLKTIETKEYSIFEKIKLVDQKIKAREALIDNLAREKDLLSKDIKVITTKNLALKKQIKEQKDRYSKLVFSTYKTQLNNQSKMLFLLSSNSFNQVYRRYKYMQQVSDYRRKQTLEIQAKSEKLKSNILSLKLKEKEVEKALVNQLKQAEDLKADKIIQEKLVLNFKKQKKQIASKIKNKRKIQSQLEAEIQSEINSLIKGRKKTSPKKFEKPYYNSKLMGTPLAKSFYSNKRKLPWPVKGRIVEYFGKHAYPGLKNVYTYNDGIDIKTRRAAIVKSVFKGKVAAILVNNSNMTKTVMIQHGGYFTIYKNLIKVKVSKGEGVQSRQSIGVVSTDKRNRTILSFLIYKQTQKLNPTKWLVRM